MFTVLVIARFVYTGIGWSMVIMSGIVTVYYNLIITWVLYFLYQSFTSKLPWSSCDNWWNTVHCSVREAKNITSLNETMDIYLNGSAQNVTVSDIMNSKKVSPAEEFWQ
jgi:SNF family Na+-dependent transporter